MNDDQDPIEELPDGLKAVVNRIVTEPAPENLASGIRSRLDASFRSESANPRVHANPQVHGNPRAKLYAAVAAVTCLAAAILAVAMFWSHASDIRLPERNQEMVAAPESQTPSTLPPSTRRPSLLAYQYAAVGSLDQMDRLLFEHSSAMLTPDGETVAKTDLMSVSQYLEE